MENKQLKSFEDLKVRQKNVDLTTFMFYILILCFVFYVLNPGDTFAAEIYFGVQSKEVAVNEKFEIAIFIDTKEEFINAAQGNVVFPKDSIEFQGVISGRSIMSLWVKQPYLVSDGKIMFSGVVPGGFIGNKGYLFSLIFKAKQKGQIVISIESEKILLNDGTGSKASITKAPMMISVIEKDSSLNLTESFLPLYDPNPPEVFQIHVAKDPNIFSGKWFLAFDTQDKESGIDHYEILEKPRLNSIFSLIYFQKEQWIKTESPYLLKDQSLKSVILVSAFDRAGNYTTVALPAKNKIGWYENIWMWVIIILISVIILISYKLWRKFQKRQ